MREGSYSTRLIRRPGTLNQGTESSGKAGGACQKRQTEFAFEQD
jgi:hypothetical protein